MPEAIRRSKNFTFRGTPELHEKLRIASNLSGRTVSDEIADRLHKSLDAGTEHSVGSPADIALGQLVAFVMAQVGVKADWMKHGPPFGPPDDARKKWQEDPFAYDQAVIAANKIFEALRPKGDREPPQDDRPEIAAFMKNLGANGAQDWLKCIAADEPKTVPATAAWLKRVKQSVPAANIAALKNMNEVRK